MRFFTVLVLLAVFVASTTEARTCYASGDPHIRSFSGYFNNFDHGWRRFYELHGNKVIVFQSETPVWKSHTTMKKIHITTAGGLHFKFEVNAANGRCQMDLKHGHKNRLVRWGQNGWSFRGHNGFNFRLNAGCAGSSGYTNIEVDDNSVKRGYGFCFRRGHKLPQAPKKCKGGLRHARHACRQVRCHEGIYASCVDDVCLTGKAEGLEGALKRLSKARNGKPCKVWKGLKKYGKQRKLCFRSCKSIWENCKKAARCARKLSGKSYMGVCKKRRHSCKRACRKNWRRARHCIIGCFKRQRGCRKLARCAAGIVDLKYVCKARGNKCAAHCFSRITKH